MKTYQVAEGSTLVFSVDDGAWETVVFAAGGADEPAPTTAEELARALNRSGTLAAYADDEGTLVLATASRGAHTSLDLDLARSTAAAALGLAAGWAHARGSGLQAARLVSRVAAPFPLPRGAEMTVVVDERRYRVTFDKQIAPGNASALQVVGAINAKRRIARVTRDARVVLTSPTVGLGSRLLVEAGRPEQPDAAAILGFVGAAALSWPHPTEPATLVCSGQRAQLRVVNLSASPIEFLLPTGRVVLPPREALPLSPSDVAHGPLQRLIEQGAVRLTSAADT
jgi:hypothetical protein